MVRKIVGAVAGSPIRSIGDNNNKGQEIPFGREVSKVDSHTPTSLIGKQSPHIPSYFTGAPVWSEEDKQGLYGFVTSALGNNVLFKGKLLAQEECAHKICEAIVKSPQLTAKFLPFISRKQ